MNAANMKFSPESIYRDLMKLVHPDIHPEMKDATEKAQLVNGSKNNVFGLRTLAIKWGYIKPSFEDVKSQTTHTYTYTRPRPEYRYGNTVINSLYDLFLNPNTRYENFRTVINVVIKIKNREYTCRVLRTTLKCVVVDFFGVEKTVRMANVVRRVKE